MVEYTCHICNKSFNHKGHYDNHLKRRFPCKPQPLLSGKHNDTLTFNQCPKNGKDFVHYSRYNPPKNGRKGKSAITMNNMEKKKNEALTSLGMVTPYYYDNTMTSKSEPKNDDDIMYLCNWCRAPYKYKNNWNRHIKTCSHRKMTLENIKSYEKKIDHLQEEIKEIKNNKMSVPIVNITNNTNNFLYVDNRITNINQIKLNPFGKESIAHITTEVLQKALQKPHLGLINLIKEVHFNNNVPENHNVQLINKREPYLQVFNGEKWEKQDKKATIQNMIASKKDLMDDYYDDQVEKNLINSFIKNNYEKFTTLLDEYVNQQLVECTEQVKNRVKNRCQKLYREIYQHTEILLQQNKSEELNTIEYKNEIKD